jgi:hypothetical protein
VPSSQLPRARITRFAQRHKSAYSIGNITIRVSQ